jgi:uncharacterized protein (DUF1800 family)
MVTTPRPLQEKMVLFWHGLFATAARGVGDVRMMYLQNENFRGNFDPATGQVVRPNPAGPFPVGNFRDILESLSMDPAMLYWLDNWKNRKRNSDVGSNENYARELMELFSLGVEDVVARMPNYTERDVKQASRALTGWSLYYSNFYRVFQFNNAEHDPGPFEVLGVTFRGTGRQLFDIIVQHKNPGQQQSAAGRFLGYRLFKFFGYDEPEPEIINALADVFDGAHGEEPYSIRNVLRTLFTPGNPAAEAFYSDRAFKAHVKSPTEYVVTAFLMLRPDGLPRSQTLDSDLTAALIQMGQLLFSPPNVGGWKEGINWINTRSALARVNFAFELITRRSSQEGIDVEGLVRRNRLRTAEEVVDYFCRLLLQTKPSAGTRTNLINYLLAGADPGAFNVNAPGVIDNKVRGLIFLIMATPEYQLS